MRDHQKYQVTKYLLKGTYYEGRSVNQVMSIQNRKNNILIVPHFVMLERSKNIM